MSLTAFNRLRRIQQVEKMKPENIKAREEKELKEQVIEASQKTVEEPVKETKEEVKSEAPRRRRRN